MKNSRGRRSWKPPSDSESFASFKAAKETYCNINYQIECLNELYNQLIPQNGIHQRANSSSRAQDGSQRDPKVLQKLRELKANLRSNYGSPRDFPPLERLKVVVMFDDHKKAFFDIRLRPRLGYPTGYPFFIDDNDKGTIVGISEAIFQEVLKAVQEEEEERDFGEGYNNNNNSHAAEDWQEPVNIKQEVYEDEELITLEDDIDEERYSDELQQEERYNSQAISPPPASENSDLSEDFTGSANLGLVASASSSSSATVPPENGLAASPQATDTDNSSSSNNTAEQEQRQTSVSSSGSTVNRRQSETLGLPIKLEPAGCSIATFTRVARPPKRAHRMAPEEAPAAAAAAAAAASVAVPPPAAAASNIRVIQVNPRATNTNTNTNMFQSQSKPQQQQLPPAGALTIEPTENSSVYLILNNNNNNNKRPAGNSNAAQPSSSHAHSQGNPKRSKVSAAAAAAATAGTSTFSSSTQAARATSQAVAEHFLASAAFVEAPKARKLDCPLCRKAFVKAAMSDHLEMEHTNRGHYVPYRCNYPGCKFTNLYRVNVLRHVQRKHGSRNAKQYIVKPAAAAAVVMPTARTAGSSSLVSRSSAAASAKRRAAAAAATAASTTSKPSTARTSLRQRQQQKQQKQQQRPSTSASTTSTSQGVLSAEDYLRANCPEYAAAGNSRTRVKCPDCPMTKTKYELKDHYLAKHRRLKPYHCQWPGCSYTSGWQTSAARHVKDVHKDSSYAQYIVYREEE